MRNLVGDGRIAMVVGAFGSARELSPNLHRVGGLTFLGGDRSIDPFKLKVPDLRYSSVVLPVPPA